jgi:hypothetical protein
LIAAGMLILAGGINGKSLNYDELERQVAELPEGFPGLLLFPSCLLSLAALAVLLLG